MSLKRTVRIDGKQGGALNLVVCHDVYPVETIGFVEAVYDQQRIAVHLTQHDLRQLAAELLRMADQYGDPEYVA